nr:DUF3575 domain-containing protein [uncultured Flavobacterium sp.]
MKKIAVIACLLGGIFTSQAQKLNEVKWNVFNTIVITSVELGYEHFVDTDQSVGAQIILNDRFSYATQNSKEGKYKKFKTSSIAANYNFYFGGKDGEHASGYYVSPFLKYRFGSYDHDKNVDGHIQRLETDMNSFILGVGVGYKLVKNDSFTLSPFVNIGRNFSDEVVDQFSGIEFNAGINLGYRF